MSDGLFGSAFRLKNSFEFRRVREKGASFRDKIFGVTLMNNGGTNHRLGLSIGKSAVPLASRRNRLKRIIREVFRVNKKKFKGGPYDVVVYVRRPIPDNFDYKSARNNILALMEKSRIL